MPKMRAILKGDNVVSVTTLAKPEVTSGDDIIICIKLAGLCRTDVFVADGLIQGKKDLVLGHEFSGVVESTGANVSHVTPGDRVTVMPVIPCGKCQFCTAGEKDSCQDTTMLGIDHDGGFAEYIRVPANTVYALPDSVTDKQGAYSEPVAASLSVLKSGIRPDEKGFVYGNNRFGQLIVRILQAHGFKDVSIFDPASNTSLPENSYDFAIETMATNEAMDAIFAAVKPRGKVILKSRKHDPVGINFNTAVKKEITLCAVNYGDFGDAIALMANGRLQVDDLLGDIHTLEEFETVFRDSKTDESLKSFFTPGREKCAA